MKVPASPTSTASVNRPPVPAEGGTAGRTERDDTTLQEDVDLFKQAMSDTPADKMQRGETATARADAFPDKPGRMQDGGTGAAARADAFPDKPGRMQDGGTDAAARADAFPDKPGRMQDGGTDAAARADAFPDKPGRMQDGGTDAAARADAFPDKPGRMQDGGTDAAARADAFQGEPGKTRESGSEASATLADKKEAPGLETTDETRPEAGVEAQQDLQQLLATQVTQARMATPAQRAEASAPAAISSELVSDVAQRILVSAGQHGQDKEVRIQVKDTVLNDTEVVISRQKGELVVVFETRSHTDNVLLGNSRDAITAALQEALDGPVRIDINAETPDTDPRDRHDRRSRGMYIQDDDV